MNYRPDKKGKKKKVFQTLFLILLFLVFLYFRTSVFSGLSYAGNTVFKPFITSGGFVTKKVKDLGAYFAFKKNLEKENQDLRARLLDNENRMANYNTLRVENEELKEILGRVGGRKVILAAILSKPNKSPYDTLLIDIGEDKNILVGDTVFALGSVPLGKVLEVYPRSSKVLLFSNAGERTQVVLGTNGTYLDLIGRGGGNFEIILPRDFVLEKGNEVVLPGITPYVVARVDSIVSDTRDSFQKVLLTTPVNIQTVRFVEVEK